MQRRYLCDGSANVRLSRTFHPLRAFEGYALIPDQIISICPNEEKRFFVIQLIFRRALLYQTKLIILRIIYLQYILESTNKV